MQLTSEQVEHIAKLARLELASEEKDAFQRQLSSVLEYVDQLSKVDTRDVEPMNHSLALQNVMRADEATPCTKEERDGAVAAFPEREGDLLKVKAVFG
jgi:aspartyl-tRNA(Asn)/glutamyl-tRNA(Gln) amidotransferase subunit C